VSLSWQKIRKSTKILVIFTKKQFGHRKFAENLNPLKKKWVVGGLWYFEHLNFFNRKF